MRKNEPVTERERLFPSAANILSTTDLKSNITYISDDFIDVSGFEEQELLGETHNMVRHPFMPSAAFASLWKQLQSGQSWMGMVKNRCKNGDHYWVDAYATPIMDKGTAKEYQSVRVKPSREHVDRATALYKKINAGTIPRFLSRSAIGLRLKSAIGITIVAAITVLISSVVVDIPLYAALTLFALFSLLGTAVVFSLLAPLEAAIAKARSITNDPLAMHVYTGRNDEAGQILLAIKSLESETGAIVGRINDFSSQVATNVEGLFTTVQNNVGEIQQLYDETTQVAAATNEMSASIQEVARNAQSAADSATSALQNALSGKQAGEQVKESIMLLAGQIQTSAKVIQQVGVDTDAISSVIDVIRSVAEQTNLLALNAAIEAARAGEHGRGFAVVADEVRTLATRTRESTEEIMVTIEKLQIGARSSVKQMDSASQMTSTSVSEVDVAVEFIEKITESIGVINDMNTQTAAAVEQQSVVAEQISTSIVRVKDLADGVMDSSKKSEQVCDTVKVYTNQLIELARQFWSKKSKAA